MWYTLYNTVYYLICPETFDWLLIVPHETSWLWHMLNSTSDDKCDNWGIITSSFLRPTVLISISPKKPTAITLPDSLASRLTSAGAGAWLSKWISLMRLHTSSPGQGQPIRRRQSPDLTNESQAHTWLLTRSHLWWWGQPCPAPGSGDPQTYRRSTTYKIGQYIQQ